MSKFIKGKEYQDKEWLKIEYEAVGSLNKIAKDRKWCYKTVLYWFHKHNLSLHHTGKDLNKEYNQIDAESIAREIEKKGAGKWAQDEAYESYAKHINLANAFRDAGDLKASSIEQERADKLLVQMIPSKSNIPFKIPDKQATVEDTAVLKDLNDVIEQLKKDAEVDPDEKLEAAWKGHEI